MTDQPAQTRLRPIIRVFVSSTFSDLKLERDALQQWVFPKLEQLCQRNGFQFQAIDLRWGVSTEAGLDHRAMQICFEELRRSQEVSPEPNFLILLGDRYGWRPLPEAISQAEFDVLLSATEPDPKRMTIVGTDGKSAAQVLKEWYCLDENFLLPDPLPKEPDRVPLNYVLQSRQRIVDGRLKYGRQRAASGHGEVDTPEWLAIQGVLWDIINAAFPATSRQQATPSGTPPDSRFENRFQGIDWEQHIADVHNVDQPKRAVPQIVRFQGSATEQEIWGGALSSRNAAAHVLAFFRRIENLADFRDAEQASQIANLKDFVNLVQPDPSTEAADSERVGPIDEAAHKAQEQLKGQLQLRLRTTDTSPSQSPGVETNNVYHFTARLEPSKPNSQGEFTVGVTQRHILRLCARVKERLTKIIQRQFDEYWATTAPSSPERKRHELKLERREHWRFAKERGPAESFVGRNDKLTQILDYIRTGSPFPLVIHGTSGCGKTGLLARAAQHVAEDFKTTGKQSPILRFIGVTPRSSDLRSLLTSLCEELRQRPASPGTGEISTDINELSNEFDAHFRAATVDSPIVLFLDALDQLSDADNGRQLHWLPYCRKSSPLPPHVRVVCSCLHEPDEKDNDPVNQPHTAFKTRQLPDSAFIELKELAKTDAADLLHKHWLFQANRKVNPHQSQLIERRLESAACRQPLYLKLLFEEAKLWRSYDSPVEPGNGVPALLDQLFDRLSLETNHGELLVNRALGYIAAARRGLSETEILEVLFIDHEYKTQLDDKSKLNNHQLPTNPKRIPIAIWSRLRSDLAPYLTEYDALGVTVITFYHRQVSESSQRRYLGDSAEKYACHERLARYFAAPVFNNLLDAGTTNGPSWHDTTPHSLWESLYQLASAGLNSELTRTLLDICYLDCRCFYTDIYDFIVDFELLAKPTAAEVGEFHAFLRRHAQRLTKHRGLFLTLVTHEGSPAAQAKAREYGNGPTSPRPWFETHQVSEPTSDATGKGRSIKVLTHHTLLFRSACGCLAEYRGIAFFLETLGSIVLLNVARGIELSGRLYVRHERTLGLFVTPTADFVAVAYENGQADLIHVTIDDNCIVLLGHVPVCSFEYLVPEYDQPIMGFVSGTLWYQSPDGRLSSICTTDGEPLGSATTLTISHLTGELSGIAVQDESVLVADRIATGTELRLYRHTTQIATLSQGETDVLCCTACGPEQVAIAYSDRQIIIYTLCGTIAERLRLAVNESPAVMTWSSGELVWGDWLGRLHAWKINPDVQPDVIQCEVQEWVSAFRLAAVSDDVLCLLGSEIIQSFRIASTQPASGSPLLAVFPHDEQRAHVIQLRENGLWLIGAMTRQETFITKESNRWYAFGRDGRNHIVAAHMSGIGFVIDLQGGLPQLVGSFPSNITAVAPHYNAGFWLGDSRGVIHFLGMDGVCRPVTRNSLPNIGKPQVFSWGDLVVWIGICVGPSGDIVDVIRAFKIIGGGGKLHELGTRFFPPGCGAFCGVTYEPQSDRLLLLWQQDGRVTVRHGSVAHFLSENDIGPLALAVEQGVERISMTFDGSAFYVLNTRGDLYRLNSHSFAIEAVLAGSLRLTELSHDGHDALAGAAPLMFVEMESCVYSVRYHARKR